MKTYKVSLTLIARLVIYLNGGVNLLRVSKKVDTNLLKGPFMYNIQPVGEVNSHSINIERVPCHKEVPLYECFIDACEEKYPSFATMKARFGNIPPRKRKNLYKKLHIAEKVYLHCIDLASDELGRQAKASDINIDWL